MRIAMKATSRIFFLFAIVFFSNDGERFGADRNKVLQGINHLKSIFLIVRGLWEKNQLQTDVELN